MSSRFRRTAGVLLILLPTAFFLSVLFPDATKPNVLIYLAYMGAVSLTVGLLVLGVGLIRGRRTSGEGRSEMGSLANE